MSTAQAVLYGPSAAADRVRRRAGLAAALAAGLAVASVAGCSFAPAPETPPAVQEMPDRYAGTVAAGRHEPLRWWEDLGDPALDRVVDTALEANLDLREAVARVEEVRQRSRIARSALFPALGLSADANRQSTPANTGFGSQFRPDGTDRTDGGATDGDGETPSDGPGFALPDRFDFTTYSVSLGLSYELDFWGRARNDLKAALSDYLASEDDYRTVRLGVIATAISTYAEIQDLRRQVRLTAENVDLLRERSELTEERYLRGLVGSFELYTVRALYRNAQAGLPLLESRLTEAEGRLAVLLGRYAGRIDPLLGDSLATLVQLSPVPTELPASLLEQRPDVRAAARRLEAARYRIGARRAELLPTISLSGNVGLQASRPADLFRIDQHFFNLIGSLFAPIFQGGRLRANVGVAEAQYAQRAAAYVRTVLTAYKEVVASLEALAKQRERYEFLEEQLASAEASVDLQLRSFRRGVGDYLSYLDARSSLAGVRIGLAGAERALIEARVGVHRALGGAWVLDDVPAATEAAAGPEAAPGAGGAR